MHIKRLFIVVVGHFGCTRYYLIVVAVVAVVAVVVVVVVVVSGRFVASIVAIL